jgi:predicted transcriptional regulator
LVIGRLVDDGLVSIRERCFPTKAGEAGCERAILTSLRKQAHRLSRKVKQEVLMEMLPVKPERKAQLDAYAERHGQDAVTALDEVLADYFAWEQQDYDETVQAALVGYEDVKAGRTRPAEEVYEALRLKHGI